MNNTDNKTGLGKLFNIITLIGVIIFFAWSAVQIVKLLPSAINSLASIADTVHNYNFKYEKYLISVSPEKSAAYSSEAVGISWNPAQAAGSYIFNYECKEGIAVDISYSDKDFFSIACGSDHNLGEVNQMKMKVNSEKNRLSDMTYTIAYQQKDSETSSTSQTTTISITNQNIADLVTENITSTSTGIVIIDTSNSSSTNEIVTEEKAEEKPITKPIKATKPVTPEPVYIYEIPVSNPKGITDLVLSNLNIGTIAKNVSGAMQFTVHNIGTKTSEDWTFLTKLPGGIEYVSSVQKPLKPNERAILTIEFPAVSNTNPQTVTVNIKTKSDSNTNNNYLKQTVTVSQ